MRLGRRGSRSERSENVKVQERCATPVERICAITLGRWVEFTTTFVSVGYSCLRYFLLDQAARPYFGHTCHTNARSSVAGTRSCKQPCRRNIPKNNIHCWLRIHERASGENARFPLGRMHRLRLHQKNEKIFASRRCVRYARAHRYPALSCLEIPEEASMGPCSLRLHSYLGCQPCNRYHSDCIYLSLPTHTH